MKKKGKKIFFKLTQSLFNKLGYERKKGLHEREFYSKKMLLETFFTNLKSMGLSPKHIVDVGANHGTWTRETLQYFPEAHYTLIEPQEWLQPSFQDLLDANSKITYLPVGAGSQKGSFKFTIVDRDDSCSFRYSQEEAEKLGLKQLDIPIITLNDIVNSSTAPFPDIVKIDAEGLDIEVLKGASALFGKTEVFMVEAGVVIKEFENSFLKMINFMDEKGYRLFEITDLNRPFHPKVLWLVELAFVKKNGIIDSYKIQ
ncbi:FkbM family methyltransferase [Flavobacterium sp. XGLA_31]|uniref:FkbM family methyltransferase n=1 Tax=Flavobacterium sp. XGLA_31 TaxID=3447666 RepID=UPI003F32CE36